MHRRLVDGAVSEQLWERIENILLFPAYLIFGCPPTFLEMILNFDKHSGVQIGELCTMLLRKIWPGNAPDFQDC